MMDITTLGNQRIDQKTFEQLLKHIKLKVTEEYILLSPRNHHMRRSNYSNSGQLQCFGRQAKE